MRPYEVMVILDAGLEEEAIRSVIDRTTELIRSRGGNPGSVDRWGRRRFAYELKHRWEGYYVVLRADADPSVMVELDRFLHLHALNRGILMTPFHNMALMSPDTTEADVDDHTRVFAEAATALFD